MSTSVHLFVFKSNLQSESKLQSCFNVSHIEHGLQSFISLHSPPTSSNRHPFGLFDGTIVPHTFPSQNAQKFAQVEPWPEPVVFN